MSVQFAVLSSGSRGNATLIGSAVGGLLVDCGIGPKRLGDRLASVGSAPDRIAAVLLTHTHGDHVDGDTLKLLARSGTTLYCHEGHRKALSRHEGFEALSRLSLVREFEDRPILLPDGTRVEPFPVPHGVGPTFGFRVEARPEKGSRWVAIGYVTDLGHWTDAMADVLTDVDLLALEFNHDVAMQWESGRHPALISRNVGKQGHLSNEQGADLARAVLDRSTPKRLRHLVLLHLSEQCNSPDLAISTAKKALKGSGYRPNIHATGADGVRPDLRVEAPKRRAAKARLAPPGFPWEAA